MNVLVLGNNGSGKTFLLTYYATKFKKNIYSNYKLKLDNYISLTINDLIEMKFDDGNIFIDEAYTWIESRRSGTGLNLLTSYLIYQQRKRLLDIYLTAQMFSSLDKRVRYLANIIIICEPRINFKSDDFHFIYQDKDKGLEITFTIRYKVAEKYFQYYDTYEIIDIPNKSKYEYDLLKNNSKKLLERSREIAYIIHPKLTQLTHNKIYYLLLDYDFDTRFGKTIYIYLKEGGVS